MPCSHAGVRGFLLVWPMIAWLAVWPGVAQAAYSCSQQVQRVNLLAQTSAIAAVTQALTLSCNRAPTDPASMSYSIAADHGANAQGQARRGRRGTCNNYLTYRLNRGASPGQAAPCTTTGTIWRNTGGGLITGTLNFGSSLNASHIWSYCTVSNASLVLPAGEYTDQVLVTLSYPNTALGQMLTAPLNLQLGVQTACLIDKPIDSLTVSYTSFQPNASTASVPVLVRCNANTRWTAGLQGPAAPTAPPVTSLNSQSLLGLTYSLQVTPASGTGLGNINDGQQTVTVGLNLPGGQGGRCATGSCTASATHKLVITY